VTCRRPISSFNNQSNAVDSTKRTHSSNPLCVSHNNAATADSGGSSITAAIAVAAYQTSNNTLPMNGLRCSTQIYQCTKRLWKLEATWAKLSWMREVDSLFSSSSTITAKHQPSESSSTIDDSTTDAWSSEDPVECYHQINQLSRVEGLKRYIDCLFLTTRR